MNCRFCGRVCNRPCGLAIHERTCKLNPDRKPIENHVCNFTNKGCSKEGGWFCNFCNLTFRTRKELQNHNKEAEHPVSLKQKTKESFVCKFCGKEFLSYKNQFTYHENHCIENPNLEYSRDRLDLSEYDNRGFITSEVSEYFKEKGAKFIRISYCKDGRKRVILYFDDRNPIWLSYSRYLWMSNYGEIPFGYEVDHINENRTDDRLENLQLLSSLENKMKYASLHKKRMVECTCPVCGKQFLYEKRNLSTHPNPCCSRKCGGIKSHLKT